MSQGQTLQLSQSCQITADDLHDAYVFAKLRRLGIGYLKAIETPAIFAALRGTALALKRKHDTPASPQQALL